MNAIQIAEKIAQALLAVALTVVTVSVTGLLFVV
jgi:hypothetical protein